MLRLISVLAVVMSTSSVWAADKALSSDKEKLGYAIGYQTTMQWAQGGLDIEASDIDMKAFVQAIKDGLKGKEPGLPVQDMQAAFQKLQGKMQARRAEAANKNKVASEKWLAANKKKKGVKVTKSGLQYKVIKEGKGKKPGAGDKVRVHYRGSVTSGKEFDSSYSRNQPLEISVGGVIPGWTEALQMMSEGSKWTIYIPAELGYGVRGSGRSIGPNEALVFDVELLKVL